MKRLIGCALWVALLLPGVATAQVNNEGFALNRFDPSERGSDWFATESLDLRGKGRFALGLVADWAHKPLVLFDANGDEIDAIVENQLNLHLGGTLTVADRIRFGLSLPLAVVNNGTPGAFGGSNFAVDEGPALGDLRLGADLRLFGEYGDVMTGALGVRAHLPTGSRAAFTGDGGVRIVPRLSVAGEIGIFAYGAHAGINIRTQNENFAGEPFGTEFVFGASAGLWFADHTLLIGPEVLGTTVVSDSGDGAFERKTTPLELILGGHYRLDEEWRMGAGVGPGLSRGFGSPKVRVLLSIEWVDEIEKKKKRKKKRSDRDNDGIYDEDDACPDEAGPANDDEDLHGCPLPNDRDGDGIIDDEDDCPDEPGPESDEAGKNGCPKPKDRDKDGILDEDDDCPDDPGPESDEPGKNGCPKAKIEQGQIKILERIEFDTNKATIRSESEGVLNAVLEIMREHEEIELIRVEGHTDDRGRDSYNLKLSDRRAAAVVTWLTERGIDGDRLTSKGFGETRPIEDNGTEEGRQENRRVEFHIERQADSDTDFETY